jgi:predicted protein tyrosine phosphatase
MSEITYGAAPKPSIHKPFSHETASRTRPSLFMRLLNAVIESRMRSAQIEINRHLHLLPEDVRRQLRLTAARGRDAARD